MRALIAILLISAALTAPAATTNFFEGFESGLANWIVGDGNATGTPTYWGIVGSTFGGEGTHNGGFKAYCAGAGFAGTTVDPRYRDSMTAYLERTVNLTGHTNATLSFWYKIPSIESCCDFARVMAGNTELWSTNGVQLAWTLVNLSLESFIGTTQTLRFEFYSDGSITNEGWYLDDITLTDAATTSPPPANDDFSSARVIVGSIGSVGSSNRGATSEAGEPDPGNSIWFRWTPYTNGIVTFRTGGSAFDTLLCVYTGNSLASLASVACDDNSDTNNASLVSFNATGGATYYISVRGAGGDSGFVLLSWEQPNGLGNDLLPDLSVWASAPNSYLYGWYLDQDEPTEPGRTLMRVSTATPNTGAGKLELRGDSSAPGVYQRIFRADGSSYDRFAGNFTFHPNHGHLHFDNWINLHLRAVLTNDGVGGIIASGHKTSFAIIDLVRYDPSLPGSPSSGQYTGGLVQGLSVGWADIYTADLQDQWIDVTDVPSGRYWLEAVVDPADSILESNETNNAARILVNLTVPSNQPPPNDQFSNSIVIPTVTAGEFGYNFRATSETGEPPHFTDNDASRSVWWRWTAPSNMNISISTDGSSFDTVLAVYVGTNVSNLTSIVFDDDSGVGNNSRVGFSATSGVTYHIAVDGFTGASGEIQLHLNPAWNDQFANCLVITGANGAVSASTRGATRQAGEPIHAGVSGSGSIWFCWTAPASAPFTFDTSGSGFDTLLGIYAGSTVSALTPIASDNNSGSNGASRVTFNAVSDTLYRIAVAGVPGATGVVKLAWSGPSPPAIVTPPHSTNAIAGASVSFTVAATGTSPLAYQWRHQGTNLSDDIYHSGVNSPTLILTKIQAGDSGLYSVVITNVYGAITSAPGNLIVLDNPRVVFIEESFGHSGAFVRVPVEMQGLGDEHAVSFSLLFDPAVLSNPRATNIPAGATLVLNTNQLGSGALGVSLTLPSLTTFATGHVHIVDFIFDTAPSSEGVNTFAGFGVAPTARVVTATNGALLPALFVAGTVDLEPLRLASGAFTNGAFRLSFPAIAGQGYVIDASTNLVDWTPLATNTAVSAIIEFTDTNAQPHQFYRVRLARGGSSSANIQFDATSGGEGNGVASITFSHTCSGADRILLVGIFHNGPADHVQSVTYNGVPLTRLANTNVSNAFEHELWYLVAPATGANAIVVTHNAIPADLIACAVSYTGVHQSTPFGTAVTGSGTSSAPGVSVSSANGEVVVDTLGAYKGDATDPVVDASQTLRGHMEGFPDVTYHSFHSSEAGASSVTMSWATTCDFWALIGVPLKPSL
jgi:hypothetical protein